MEYLKQSKDLQRNVILCIVFVSITILAFYFYMFNSGLSKDSNSWSNFGDYVNGLLTPFLTAINNYVFIKKEHRGLGTCLTIQKKHFKVILV